MKKRSTNILYQIISNNIKKMNIDVLSKEYEVSQRTLRNDIKEINSFLKMISMSPIELNEEGFILLSDDFDSEMIKEELCKMDIYDYKLSSKERQMLIIVELIMQDDYIAMEKIGEELYVTRVTIINDFKFIKDFLERYNVSLQSKSSKGIILKYEEKSVRILLIELFREIVENVRSDGYFQRVIISKLEMKYSFSNIVELLQEFEKEDNIFFTDSIFYEVALALFIGINRFQKGNIITKCNINTKISLDFPQKIIKYMEKKLGIDIPQNEVLYFEEYINENELLPVSRTFDDIELYKVISYFLSEIGKAFQLDFKTDSILVQSLVMHVKTANNMKAINLDLATESGMQFEFQRLLEEVEKYCYILERYLCYELERKMKESIVIHICAAMVRNKMDICPLSVIIVCPGSMATGKLLEAQIKNYFDFNIKGVVSAHKLLSQSNGDNDDIDFIISTVNLSDSIYPVVTVNALLSMKDLNIIQQKAFSLGKKITLLSKEKVKKGLIKRLEEKLQELENVEDLNYIVSITENLIDSHKKQNEKITLSKMLKLDEIQILEKDINWEEAMVLSGSVLESKGYFGEKYIKKAVDNVKQWGPYIIIAKGIALVHASKEDGVFKDGLSLLVLKNGVLFDEEKEKVYFLFCFCTRGEIEYMDLFKEIISLGNDENKKEILLNSKTEDEIYSKIISF